MIRSFAGQTCRDRTGEFSTIVERLRKEVGGAGPSNAHEIGGSSLQPFPAANGQTSDFSRRAAVIGQGIHSVSQKLFKLSQLAKAPPGPFDDGAQEITALSAIVKQEIQGLNTAIADLQNVSAASVETNRQSTRHTHTVVGSLRSRLKDTTKEFKDVLTIRQENLKAHQGRRQLFSATPDRPLLSSRPATGDNLGAGSSRPPGDGRPLFPGAQARISPPESNGSSSAWGPESAASEKYVPPSPPQPSTPPVRGELRQRNSSAYRSADLTEDVHQRRPLLQNQQQALMVPQQDTYLNSRAEALHNVESTITELGGIFQQLAHMVQEQGEMAIRIDENIDDTLANVDSAQTQLLKYLNSISSNRWLIMKIFFVLMAFLVVFVVFIA